MATLHQFYATSVDMEPGLAAIERSMAVEYVRAGIFSIKAPARFPSAMGIPDFGLFRNRRTAGQHNYLVVPAGAEIMVEEVQPRRGGVAYVVDHRANPSVIFRPGGMFESKCLIAGEVGTPLTDDASLAIWKLFTKHFWREFVAVGQYRVGPEALRLLHSGVRLTPDMSWSPETDLSPAAIAASGRSDGRI